MSTFTFFNGIKLKLWILNELSELIHFTLYCHILVGVSYMRSSKISWTLQFFQHEMTKCLTFGPRKKCAGTKSKMAAIFAKKMTFLAITLLFYGLFTLPQTNFTLFLEINQSVHTLRLG